MLRLQLVFVVILLHYVFIFCITYTIRYYELMKEIILKQIVRYYYYQYYYFILFYSIYYYYY